MPESIKSALANAQTLLVSSENPGLEADILLAYCLDRDRSYLVAHGEHVLDRTVSEKYHYLIARRAAGEPVAYLLGKKAFWNIELIVNEDVLIPRPETELLVETALELAADRSTFSVLDLGTGSGAIVLALAKNKPEWQLTAVDKSVGALDVARRNAAVLEVRNVKFLEGSWCQGLATDSFDMVIANPPYVAPGDSHLEQGDLRFEPGTALVAAQAGFADLFAIIDQARVVLKSGGWLLLEHGFDQHLAVAEKLLEAGYSEVQSRQDISGHERMTQARWLTK